MKKRLYFTTILTAIVALLMGVTVFAQTNDIENGQALEIAPPVISLKADPGQTITTQISLRDVSRNSLIVKSQINDFVAADENGTPNLILEDEEEVDNIYSLKNWIDPFQDMTLEPKEIKNLPVTIRVPKDAAPGGYYGVVRFTATAPELQETGVSLSASLGALILVRVNGDVKQSVAIEEFSLSDDTRTGTLFESTPLNFIVRIKNNGNVHEQPVGQITITDMFNNTVAKVNVNLEKRNILPDSIRRFESSLDKSVLGNKKLFGRYKAELKVTYGDNSEVVTSNLEFWIIPYRLIILFSIAFVTGFILLRFSIKKYNAHIIKKAQKRK